MRRPLVEVYLGVEIDLVDDYAPGFREAEDQGNGLMLPRRLLNVCRI